MGLSLVKLVQNGIVCTFKQYYQPNNQLAFTTRLEHEVTSLRIAYCCIVMIATCTYGTFSLTWLSNLELYFKSYFQVFTWSSDKRGLYVFDIYFVVKVLLYTWATMNLSLCYLIHWFLSRDVHDSLCIPFTYRFRYRVLTMHVE